MGQGVSTVTHPIPGSCAAVCCLTTNRASCCDLRQHEHPPARLARWRLGHTLLHSLRRRRAACWSAPVDRNRTVVPYPFQPPVKRLRLQPLEGDASVAGGAPAWRRTALWNCRQAAVRQGCNRRPCGGFRIRRSRCHVRGRSSPPRGPISAGASDPCAWSRRLSVVRARRSVFRQSFTAPDGPRHAGVSRTQSPARAAVAEDRPAPR